MVVKAAVMIVTSRHHALIYQEGPTKPQKKKMLVKEPNRVTEI